MNVPPNVNYWRREETEEETETDVNMKISFIVESCPDIRRRLLRHLYASNKMNN